MKRIGMMRIAQESNALSPFLSELADFHHDFSGDALMEITGPDGTEAEGFTKSAELSGFRRAAAERDHIEVVPLFSSWAVPGGPLSQKTLDVFRERIRTHLATAGDLDGVFISLHGAMVGEGGTRPETLLLQDLREQVGDAIPIVASIDLHAHITADFMAPLTAVAAYRTNPHRDHERTGYRAGTMLLDIVDGRLKPTMAWRHLPMVMGGGTTLDFLQPMRALFGKMKAMEVDDAVEYVSLSMCHLWLDAQDLGWSTIVVTNDDQDKAEHLAERLADEAWALRYDMPPELPSAQEAIETARSVRLRRRLGTVVISDASDMVGCGAPGDNTRLLAALLEATDLRVFTAIRDTETTHSLWQQPDGSTVDIQVGGRHRESGPAQHITGTLVCRHDSTAFGKRVRVDLGHLQLVVTERSPLVMKPAFYKELGLKPMTADICVVKSLFPFRMYFAAQNRKTLYAKTEGASDFDAALRVDYELPTHPKDFVESWRPADRIRRGLSS